ncbi:MAG: hypothetical protein SNJ60_05275 [Pseudanabaenaceae cyanobacterium]
MIQTHQSRGWDIADWFTLPLPDRIAQFLANASEMKQLHVHDLLVGNHRLLDFWASSTPKPAALAPADWSEELWGQAQATLNPLLRVEPLRERLNQGLATYMPQSLHPFLPQTVRPDETVGWLPQVCLHGLWDNGLPVTALVSQVAAWLPDRAPGEVERRVRQALGQLEKTLAVFLTMP